MCDCSKHHEEIASLVAEVGDKVANIDKKLEYHLGTTHQHLVDARTIKTWDEEILKLVKGLEVSHSKLADAVMGEQVADFDGVLHRIPMDSLTYQVSQNTNLLKEQGQVLDKQGHTIDRIEHQLGNGLKLRISVSDQVKVALIAAAATLISVLLGG